MASPYAERIARLETMVEAQAKDTAEIKADVKTLLQSKWRVEGKRSVWTVIISAVTGIITAILSR